MDSPNGVLNQFITDYRTAYDITTFLLSIINDVLTGKSQKQILISETLITAVVGKYNTIMYSDPDYSDSDEPEFSLPSLDFKLIIEAWQNFISAGRDLQFRP